MSIMTPSMRGNELHESVAWYMQNLNISSITLISFTQKPLCAVICILYYL